MDQRVRPSVALVLRQVEPGAVARNIATDAIRSTTTVALTQRDLSIPADRYTSVLLDDAEVLHSDLL